MNLFNEQVANAYAIAKTLGYEFSVQEFQKEYSQYHDEALKALNSNCDQSIQLYSFFLSIAFRRFFIRHQIINAHAKVICN